MYNIITAFINYLFEQELNYLKKGLGIDDLVLDIEECQRQFIEI